MFSDKMLPNKVEKNKAELFGFFASNFCCKKADFFHPHPAPHTLFPHPPLFSIFHHTPYSQSIPFSTTFTFTTPPPLPSHLLLSHPTYYSTPFPLLSHATCCSPPYLLLPHTTPNPNPTCPLPNPTLYSPIPNSTPPTPFHCAPTPPTVLHCSTYSPIHLLLPTLSAVRQPTHYTPTFHQLLLLPHPFHIQPPPPPSTLPPNPCSPIRPNPTPTHCSPAPP